MEGKPGACGFLSVLFRSPVPSYLIKIDEETGEPIRDADGLCIVCEPGKPVSYCFCYMMKNQSLQLQHYFDCCCN